MFSAPSTLTHRDSTYPFIDPSRHKDRLKGKIALITGAGRGIGKETASALANAGARVICVARGKTGVEQVAEEINRQHQSTSGDVETAIGVAGDVSDPEAAQAVIKEVLNRWGKETAIDVLVASAGMTRFNTVENEDEKLDEWWQVISVNLRGTVSFVRAVLPGMRARGSGVVISLASTSGSQDIPFNSAYACSKAAIIKFNQDLALELQDSGVSCFALHPGTIETGLGTTAGAVDMEEMKRNKKMQQVFAQFQRSEKQTVDLPANTIVALCVEDDAKRMSGKYIDSETDIGELLAEAKKGREGRIEKEKLYRLKMDEL